MFAHVLSHPVHRSKLVAQNLENSCAFHYTFQRVGSRAVAERNDIFNSDQRGLRIERCWLLLLLLRFFGLIAVLFGGSFRLSLRFVVFRTGPPTDPVLVRSI